MTKPQTSYYEREVKLLRNEKFELIVERDKLRQALAIRTSALEQDARRYRWLRDKARSVDWSRNYANFAAFSPNCRTSPEQMDRDIDIAIGDEPEMDTK